MKHNSKRRIESSSSLQITDIHIKNHHSTNHFFQSKKPTHYCLQKKTAVRIKSEENINQRQSTSNPKNYPSTPKNKKDYHNKISFAYLNINSFGSSSNSVKNSSKRIFDYTSNNYMHKTNSNHLSLYTIHEQMRKMSNGIISKSNNGHIQNKKTSEASLTKKIISSCSKLFQLKRISFPLQYIPLKPNNKNNIKVNDSPQVKSKYNYTNYNINNTHSNTNTQPNLTQSNINTNYRNVRKRNSKYLPSPKRFLSLNKNKSYKNSITNYRKMYPICTILKGSNHKPFHTIDKTKNIIKSKSMNKTRIKTKNDLSNSLKKEQPVLTVNNDIVNLNIIDSKSKDSILPKTSQNSMFSQIRLQLTNDSTDNCHIKGKSQIKVNLKMNLKQTGKKYHNNETFIKLYSSYLSQKEIDELKIFPYDLYYIKPFEKRVNTNFKYINEMTCTFSYKHFPNFTFASFPRSHSYKSFNEIYIQSDMDDYNDEDGNYNLIQGDHILYRYEIIQLLGIGSFGEAVKCLDHKTGQTVCVKIIKSNPKFYAQAMMEIRIIKHMIDNDPGNESNIVKLLSYFIFRNHILLDINLYEHIKMNDYNGFDKKMIKTYTTKLLFTLLFLKKNKILHCDLKPENILLSIGDINNIKVIDFGSSCFEKRRLYAYIQSRFYRAPEVILEQGYNYEIDMWSLGCILPELYVGMPIFPGDDEKEQLMYIMEYLGIPSQEYISKSRKKLMFYDENNHLYHFYNSDGSLRKPNTKTLTNFLNDSDELFQDLIKRCLKWIPKERITPDQALMHKWIINEMSQEELLLHKRKIRRTKIGLTQSNQIKEISMTDRPFRNYEITENTKLFAFQTDGDNKISPVIKSPSVKSTTKREQCNNISSCLYNITTKKANNRKKLALIIETISNLKKQRGSSSKKKSKPRIES